MNRSGYCSLLDIQKNYSDYCNVYKTLFYPVRLDEYIEHHKICQILEELLFKVLRTQPKNETIYDFLIDNLLEISEKQTCLKVNNCGKYLESQGSKSSEAAKLKFGIKTVHPENPLQNSFGKWNHRVLIVGRKGSGRKTQAKLLAQEFGVVFIDMEKQFSTISNIDSLESVQHFLLKPECLHNGYVLVSNVLSLKDLAIVMEKFIHRPNLVVFLHTSEVKCRRRISKSFSEMYINHQFMLYDLHKKQFRNFFSKNSNFCEKIFHVNGNKSIKDVKTCIWIRLCMK